MHPDLDLLAEPTRRTILALVAKERELCVCELVAALGEYQPGISRHMAILREGGWVVSRRDGTYMHYRLAQLPAWAAAIVQAMLDGGVPFDRLDAAGARLAAFGGRPPRGTVRFV